MKQCLNLCCALLLFYFSSQAACTHAANDNCANAIALTVNAAATSGVTCGTLETGELTDCAPTGTNQSVWYSFVATAANMAVVVNSTGICYCSSAVWPASDGCPATTGCEALSCQSADNGPATTVHDLTNLTVGNTYEIQIMYASGAGCGQDGSFTVQVTTTIPANPSNPAPISTCAAPSGPACVFNYNPTVNQVTATCSPYVSPGDDTSANNVVKACFTFTGEYSTNISFQNIIYGTCQDGNVDWFDWELLDSACGVVSCGNINTLTYSGVQCGQNYVMCYTYEIPDCDETEFYPYVTAIPPTFTGTSTPGGSTTGTSLSVSICQGSSVTLSGSAAGYVSYLWSPSAGLSATSGASVVATPDTTTVYTLTGFDAGGCSQSKTITVTVKPAPAAAISPSPDSITCTNPSVSLTASGGGTYHWSTGATSAGVTITTAGTFTVSVTGTNGCSATASDLISAANTPPAVQISPAADTLSCAASSFTLTASGGNSYNWSTGGTGTSITGTVANTYTVTATGANGCTASASALVSSQISNISALASATNAGCIPNGTASVTPGGGTTYTYLWSNNDTTQNISGLSAGNYTVTVTSNGCTATASASVANAGGAISLTPANTTATCGNANGTASVTASGGSNYTYSWNVSGNTSSITGLSAGNYTVTVNGGGGCSATASINVPGTAAVLATVVPAATSCGQNNGSVTASVTSGTSPITYLWNTSDTSQTVNNLAAGNYTVTVTGAGGCSATASGTIGVSGGLSISTTPTATTCGQNNGSATASVGGSGGSYTYSWSNNTSNQSISNVAAGTYTVTVTGGGCTGTDTVTIAGSSAVTANTYVTSTSCGNNNGAAGVGASGGNGVYTFLWSNSSTSDSIINLAPGNYTVTVTAGTCTATASAAISSSGVGSVTITSNKTVMCPGDSATICAPTGFVTYLWSDGDTGQCITTSFTGNYYVTTTDNGNCTAASNEISLSNYAPTPVTVSVNGDTLASYPASAYQWYFNGQAISGATGATYVATQSGNYTVEITDSHGCQYQSSVTKVNVSGIIDVADENTIRVYPNPLASGSWHVDVSDGLIGSVCQVFDANGQVVYKGRLENEQSQIELNASQGIYVMQISSADVNYTLKLIKLY